ncbi:MAG: FG-GAP repeat protein [Acidobacteria bacterium]|nr:FG-GAP repeat protein [Acidobacteriota bacterium]
MKGRLPRPGAALSSVLALSITGLAFGDGGPPAALPTDPVWEASAFQGIARAEYAFAEDGDGALTAPNRALGVRLRVSPRGLALRERSAAEEPLELSLEFRGVSRCAESASAPRTGELSLERDRAVVRRGPVVEWFENTPEGIEHGFTLDTRLDGDGRLRLSLHLDGSLTAKKAGDALQLTDARGRARLRYHALRVFDAAGSAVPARLATGPSSIVIEIDDTGATYPLRIDPLLTTPEWTGGPGQAAAQFGFSVATAGDVNGDGFSDVVVGAPLYDNGEADEGRAFVYLGSPSGLSAVAAWTAESDQAGAQFGAAVAAAGDVDGDGFDDVVVGAPLFDNGEADEGRALLFRGGPAGLESTASWTAEAQQAGARFGSSVAGAGDVDADGFADVIAGAPLFDNPQADEGRAFLYRGSAAGLSQAAAWTAEADQAGARFGAALGTAGDLNGDRFADVIIGAPLYDNSETDEGRAYAFHGSASGLDAAAAWTSEANQPNAQFGSAVAAAGDVNGDGYADAIVGAPLFDDAEADEGRALVYHGSALGLQLSPALAIEPDQPGAQLGTAVAPAGDINGDGFADVAVGAPLFDGTLADEGRVLAFRGSAGGVVATAYFVRDGGEAGAHFGAALGPAGDVDGDGFAELAAGLPRKDGTGTDDGQALVFGGAGDGPSPTAAWSAKGNQPGSYFGYSCAGAGDVNGDGYSDVLVSAYLYDGGQVDEGKVHAYYGSAGGLPPAPSWTVEGNVAGGFFGACAVGAGDVNGDGYADVLISSPGYGNGETGEGRILVFPGSPAGLATTPAWSFESNQVNAHLGVSASPAGDTNGDGYADVIAAAPFFDDTHADEGRAYVFFGSPTGPGKMPAWTSHPRQALADFGRSVAGAGDVNSDGYADIAVGARNFDAGQRDEGSVFVYHGGPDGPSAAPDWTADSNVAFSSFGGAVGAAGDVNGDGFADLVVGASTFSNGQTSEGRAFVYLGSASGLGAAPAWTAESDQANASFGVRVGSAGDVNGDGFSDVIVGATGYDGPESNEGRVYVYRGSSSGLASLPAFTAETNQPGSAMGPGAGAGDINGDGFSDIVVGAYLYDDPNTDSGQAYVHYGNGGDGLDRVPRQWRADASAPIAPQLRAPSETTFRLRAKGRSSSGRARVRLQYESKPQAEPFDGLGLVTTAATDTGAPGPSGSVHDGFDELVPGLAAGMNRWRLRVISGNPLQPRTPWLALPDNAVTLGDLRGGPCTERTYYRDADGDGLGTVADTASACDPPAGYGLLPGDCDDLNGQVWSPPGEARKLLVGAGKTLITWQAPTDPGGAPGSTLYDTLRASAADGFDVATCVESDGNDLAATDTSTPPPAAAFFYLVRAEVSCTGGAGPLGAASDGTPRTGQRCPRNGARWPRAAAAGDGSAAGSAA